MKIGWNPILDIYRFILYECYPQIFDVCSKNPSDLYIVAGTVKLTEKGQTRQVESFSCHSLYSRDSYKYDVAIIKVRTVSWIYNQAGKVLLYLLHPT